MDTEHGKMTVITPGASQTKQNGGARPAPSMDDKIAAKRADVAALKKQSNKLGAEEEEYAKLCAEENAERARLETEAAEALKSRAEIVEAECYAALPDRGDRTPLACLYDRATEKRCGVGIVVVKAHAGDAAYKALQNAGKVSVSDKGEASLDPLGVCGKSQAEILNGLLKCAVYPDADGITNLVSHGFGLAQNAYAAASKLAGNMAQQTTGKSSS